MTTLARTGGAHVERIVSPPGYASPDGFWFDGDRPEWVCVLAGAAGLQFEGEREPRRLGAGSHLLIAPGHRHRIAWTDPDAQTIWLAVHLPG